MNTLSNKSNLLNIIVVLLLVSSCAKKKDLISEWRGPDRKGVYYENNLLASWPEDGPEVLWVYDSLGEGYGSPVVTIDRIFVNGEIDSIGHLFSFDKSGKLLWKSAYGKMFTNNFPGTRSTPTVVNNRVYVTSGRAVISCFNTENGDKIWSVDMINDLHGKQAFFGHTESPAVEGDLVYCTPGGEDTNIVALNRFTGEIVWISKGKGEGPAYVSPLVFSHGGKEIFTSFTENSLIGLDALSGALLWDYPTEDTMYVNCNTPLYDNGFLYVISPRGKNGAMKFELSEDGSEITQIWKNWEFANSMGSFVKIEDQLIGASGIKRKWLRMNAESGVITDSVDFNQGTTIFADRMVYAYNYRGEMGLIKLHADSMELVSSFKIKEGTKQHFAHPVINDGVLYIRRGKALIAYNIANP